MEGIFIFGEYAPFILFEPFNAFVIGAGYAFTDNFAVGFEVQAGFVSLGLGPIVLSGELISLQGGQITDSFGESSVGKLTGLYILDLDPVTLGIGAGTLFFLNGGPPTIPLFIEGKASFAVDESISIYANFDYYVNSLSLSTFTVGASLAF